MMTFLELVVVFFVTSLSTTIHPGLKHFVLQIKRHVDRFKHRFGQDELGDGRRIDKLGVPVEHTLSGLERAVTRFQLWRIYGQAHRKRTHREKVIFITLQGSLDALVTILFDQFLVDDKFFRLFQTMRGVRGLYRKLPRRRNCQTLLDALGNEFHRVQTFARNSASRSHDDSPA